MKASIARGSRTSWAGYWRLTVWSLVLALVLLASSTASAAAATIKFSPEADTYVSASAPTTSYGTASSFYVDAKPTKQSFLRFRLSGIEGRTVVGVRLRLYQLDSSPSGGRVLSVPSNSWSESMTWETRPQIGGSPLASFGAVKANSYYDVDLGPIAGSDGAVSLAIDSLNSDGARWASRENGPLPQLIVDIEGPAPVVDGLTEVAAPVFGSSDPTYFSTNHRAAVTAGGRMLTVHGRDARGVQLAWRDSAGGWQRNTAGAVTDGLLLGGTGTGDWPTSIAIARDSAGAEHAWVVWTVKTTFTGAKPVQMVRLSDLDAPEGPSVGPTKTIDAPVKGASKADIAFERTASGAVRGCILWTRRSADTAYDLVTTWFTDLDSDIPAVQDEQVILTSSSSYRWGTLAPAADGMRVVARGDAGALRVFGHDSSAPLTSWSKGAAGIVTGTKSYPSAVALDSGELLAVVEGDTTAHAVTVQRFGSAGAPLPAELQLSGYQQPTIASDGVRAQIVMVRSADGYVVSRQFDPTSGWSTTDRVEIGTEGGGNHAYPNAVTRTDGRLRFVVRGPAGSSSKSAVLAFQRPL